MLDADKNGERSGAYAFALMSGPVRILFVDDEPLILRAIERGVRRELFTCSFTHLPKEAARILREETIDIIVTDYQMPEMSGLELLRLVHGAPTPLVKALLTSDPGPTLRAELSGLGIEWIEKPWTLEALRERLRELAEEALRRRELAASKVPP